MGDLIQEVKRVDLKNLKTGDKVVMAHGGVYPVGEIRSFGVESHQGTNTGYALWVGAANGIKLKGSPRENYSEFIGRFSVGGTNERYPHENALCKIIRIISQP